MIRPCSHCRAILSRASSMRSNCSAQLIEKLAITLTPHNPTTEARLERKIPSKPGKRTYARVQLHSEGEDGGRVTVPTRMGGAGILSSATLADGWDVVAEGREGIPVDETVAIEHWGRLPQASEGKLRGFAIPRNVTQSSHCSTSCGAPNRRSPEADGRVLETVVIDISCTASAPSPSQSLSVDWMFHPLFVGRICLRTPSFLTLGLPNRLSLF